MSDNEVLSYSADALPNRALFLSDLNDINIYVEDLGMEFEYEEIFERLYAETMKIFSIFPLGGKDAVLTHHGEKEMYDHDGKLNVFIVDGDFDNLWENEKTDSPNLVYLTRYNIESYLISKEATIRYMRRYLKCPRRVAEEKTQFNEWYDRQRVDAGKLFVLFAVARHHYPDLHSVRTAIGIFQDENGNLLEDKYMEYYSELNEKVPNLSDAMADVTMRIADKFGGQDDEKIFGIICGKYLYESLCRHLKTVERRNINRYEYRSTVIANFDISQLDFLRIKIDELRSQAHSA